MNVNKNMKWVYGIVAAILAGLLLIGSFVYVTRYRITDIDAVSSPDGVHEITFQAVGEPDWPFGYSHGRIVLKRGKQTVTKCSFDVANDGGTLCPDNWSVTWQDSFVMAVISGEEQSDILYTFYFDGTIDAESPDGLGAVLLEKSLPADSVSSEAVDLSSLVSVNESEESVFALSVHDFIECYNNVYRQYHVKPYLEELTSDKWNCNSELSLRFGYEADRREFLAGSPVWSIPIVSIYTGDNDEIYEICISLDDHIHPESAYIKYKGVCSCLLKMACPELTEKEVNEVFGKLYSLANKNFFGNHYRYGDPERPTLSELFQYGDIGFYGFYGSGNIEICMIPFTSYVIDQLGAEGVTVRDVGTIF